MKKEFTIERDGKTFVLYAGLLDAAHEAGLEQIVTTLVQIPNELNGNVAICHATVVTAKGSFTGLGDASPTNVNRMMSPHLIRMAECVPLRAEILTRQGWRTWDKVRDGDEVLAYDPASDLCRWTPLLGKTIYPEPQPVVRLESRSFAATVTREHTWAVADANRAMLRKTCDLRPSDHIVVAAQAIGGDYAMSPRQAAVLGWTLTDGTIRSDRGYPRIHIDQSKPPYVAELRELLGSDASEHVKPAGTRTFPGGKTSATRPAHRFSLTAKATRELLSHFPLTEPATLALPAIVTRMGKTARMAMLDAMLKADGSSHDGRRWVFGKKRKPGVMEAFEILCTLEGKALGRPRMSSGGVIPVRSVRENRTVAAAYLTTHLDPPPEPVWCPTTEYGTWVMRLDGFITITGNTRAKARALRDAVNVGATAFEELADLDDDGPAHNGTVGAVPARQRPNLRPVGGPRDDDGAPPPELAGAVVDDGYREEKRAAAGNGAAARFDRAQAQQRAATAARPAAVQNTGAAATPKQLETIERMCRAAGKPVPDTDGMTRAKASEIISTLIGEMGERRAGEGQ